MTLDRSKAQYDVCRHQSQHRQKQQQLKRPVVRQGLLGQVVRLEPVGQDQAQRVVSTDPCYKSQHPWTCRVQPAVVILFNKRNSDKTVLEKDPKRLSFLSPCVFMQKKKMIYSCTSGVKIIHHLFSVGSQSAKLQEWHAFACDRRTV